MQKFLGGVALGHVLTALIWVFIGGVNEELHEDTLILQPDYTMEV